MLRRRSLARQSLKRRQETPAYRQVVQRVFQRAQGRCEAVIQGRRCAARACDPHHTRKPRRSFHDVAFVVALCRPHHDAAEGRYRDGRLRVTPLGGEAFRYEVVTAPDKFVARGA